MGRRPKFTAAQAASAFKRVTEKRRHVPTSREFAKELNVSTATAWLMMIRLNLRKPCKACRGTGWERSQDKSPADTKKLPDKAVSQNASQTREDSL